MWSESALALHTARLMAGIKDVRSAKVLDRSRSIIVVTETAKTQVNHFFSLQKHTVFILCLSLRFLIRSRATHPRPKNNAPSILPIGARKKNWLQLKQISATRSACYNVVCVCVCVCRGSPVGVAG